MKQAICDNCGATDDYCIAKGQPILYGGAVLSFRDDTELIDIEICEQCADKLLATFPALVKVLRRKQGKPEDAACDKTE